MALWWIIFVESFISWLRSFFVVATKTPQEVTFSKIYFIKIQISLKIAIFRAHYFSVTAIVSLLRLLRSIFLFVELILL